MEFGRVEDSILNTIDFSLPKEPVENKKVLGGKRFPNAKVFIGCAKWGREEWVGKLYPPKTRERDFLKYYVEHYNSIELNTTHYKVYGPLGIAKWRDKARGKDFVFCPKMYQGITHKGKLGAKGFLATDFFRGIAAFEQHLGPVFIQFSDRFSPNRKKELYDYLATLPKSFRYFVEVRHPAWFSKAAIREELFDTLRNLDIGAVITDAAGRRDCVHMRLTIPKVFIRFVGNSLHPSDYTRIDEWVTRMKYWLDKGLEELYFFMHMHDEELSPELTVVLVEKMNKECGLSLKVPLLRPSFPKGTENKQGYGGLAL